MSKRDDNPQKDQPYNHHATSHPYHILNRPQNQQYHHNKYITNYNQQDNSTISNNNCQKPIQSQEHTSFLDVQFGSSVKVHKHPNITKFTHHHNSHNNRNPLNTGASTNHYHPQYVHDIQYYHNLPQQYENPHEQHPNYYHYNNNPKNLQFSHSFDQQNTHEEHQPIHNYSYQQHPPNQSQRTIQQQNRPTSRFGRRALEGYVSSDDDRSEPLLDHHNNDTHSHSTQNPPINNSSKHNKVLPNNGSDNPRPQPIDKKQPASNPPRSITRSSAHSAHHDFSARPKPQKNLKKVRDPPLLEGTLKDITYNPHLTNPPSVLQESTSSLQQNLKNIPTVLGAMRKAQNTRTNTITVNHLDPHFSGGTDTSAHTTAMSIQRHHQPISPLVLSQSSGTGAKNPKKFTDGFSTIPHFSLNQPQDVQSDINNPLDNSVSHMLKRVPRIHMDLDNFSLSSDNNHNPNHYELQSDNQHYQNYQNSHQFFHYNQNSPNSHYVYPHMRNDSPPRIYVTDNDSGYDGLSSDRSLTMIVRKKDDAKKGSKSFGTAMVEDGSDYVDLLLNGMELVDGLSGDDDDDEDYDYLNDDEDDEIYDENDYHDENDMPVDNSCRDDDEADFDDEDDEYDDFLPNEATAQYGEYNRRYNLPSILKNENTLRHGNYIGDHNGDNDDSAYNSQTPHEFSTTEHSTGPYDEYNQSLHSSQSTTMTNDDIGRSISHNNNIYPINYSQNSHNLQNNHRLPRALSQTDHIDQKLFNILQNEDYTNLPMENTDHDDTTDQYDSAHDKNRHNRDYFISSTDKAFPSSSHTVHSQQDYKKSPSTINSQQQFSSTHNITRLTQPNTAKKRVQLIADHQNDYDFDDSETTDFGSDSNLLSSSVSLASDDYGHSKVYSSDNSDLSSSGYDEEDTDLSSESNHGYHEDYDEDNDTGDSTAIENSTFSTDFESDVDFSSQTPLNSQVNAPILHQNKYSYPNRANDSLMVVDDYDCDVFPQFPTKASSASDTDPDSQTAVTTDNDHDEDHYDKYDNQSDDDGGSLSHLTSDQVALLKEKILEMFLKNDDRDDEESLNKSIDNDSKVLAALLFGAMQSTGSKEPKKSTKNGKKKEKLRTTSTKPTIDSLPASTNTSESRTARLKKRQRQRLNNKQNMNNDFVCLSDGSETDGNSYVEESDLSFLQENYILADEADDDHDSIGSLGDDVMSDSLPSSHPKSGRKTSRRTVGKLLTPTATSPVRITKQLSKRLKLMQTDSQNQSQLDNGEQLVILNDLVSLDHKQLSSAGPLPLLSPSTIEESCTFPKPIPSPSTLASYTLQRLHFDGEDDTSTSDISLTQSQRSAISPSPQLHIKLPTTHKISTEIDNNLPIPSIQQKHQESPAENIQTLIPEIDTIAESKQPITIKPSVKPRVITDDSVVLTHNWKYLPREQYYTSVLPTLCRMGLTDVFDLQNIILLSILSSTKPQNHPNDEDLCLTATNEVIFVKKLVQNTITALYQSDALPWLSQMHANSYDTSSTASRSIPITNSASTIDPMNQMLEQKYSAKLTTFFSHLIHKQHSAVSEDLFSEYHPVELYNALTILSNMFTNQQNQQHFLTTTSSAQLLLSETKTYTFPHEISPPHVITNLNSAITNPYLGPAQSGRGHAALLNPDLSIDPYHKKARVKAKLHADNISVEMTSSMSIIPWLSTLTRPTRALSAFKQQIASKSLKHLHISGLPYSTKLYTLSDQTLTLHLPVRFARYLKTMKALRVHNAVQQRILRNLTTLTRDEERQYEQQFLTILQQNWGLTIIPSQLSLIYNTNTCEISDNHDVIITLPDAMLITLCSAVSNADRIFINGTERFDLLEFQQPQNTTSDNIGRESNCTNQFSHPTTPPKPNHRLAPHNPLNTLTNNDTGSINSTLSILRHQPPPSLFHTNMISPPTHIVHDLPPVLLSLSQTHKVLGSQQNFENISQNSFPLISPANTNKIVPIDSIQRKSTRITNYINNFQLTQHPWANSSGLQINNPLLQHLPADVGSDSSVHSLLNQNSTISQPKQPTIAPPITPHIPRTRFQERLRQDLATLASPFETGGDQPQLLQNQSVLADAENLHRANHKLSLLFAQDKAMTKYRELPLSSSNLFLSIIQQSYLQKSMTFVSSFRDIVFLINNAQIDSNICQDGLMIPPYLQTNTYKTNNSFFLYYNSLLDSYSTQHMSTMLSRILYLQQLSLLPYVDSFPHGTDYCSLISPAYVHQHFHTMKQQLLPPEHILLLNAKLIKQQQLNTIMNQIIARDQLLFSPNIHEFTAPEQLSIELYQYRTFTHLLPTLDILNPVKKGVLANQDQISFRNVDEFSHTVNQNTSEPTLDEKLARANKTLSRDWRSIVADRQQKQAQYAQYHPQKPSQRYLDPTKALEDIIPTQLNAITTHTAHQLSLISSSLSFLSSVAERSSISNDITGLKTSTPVIPLKQLLLLRLWSDVQTSRLKQQVVLLQQLQQTFYWLCCNAVQIHQSLPFDYSQIMNKVKCEQECDLTFSRPPSPVNLSSNVVYDVGASQFYETVGLYAIIDKTKANHQQNEEKFDFTFKHQLPSTNPVDFPTHWLFDYVLTNQYVAYSDTHQILQHHNLTNIYSPSTQLPIPQLNLVDAISCEDGIFVHKPALSQQQIDLAYQSEFQQNNSPPKPGDITNTRIFLSLFQFALKLIGISVDVIDYVEYITQRQQNESKNDMVDDNTQHFPYSFVDMLRQTSIYERLLEVLANEKIRINSSTPLNRAHLTAMTLDKQLKWVNTLQLGITSGQFPTTTSILSQFNMLFDSLPFAPTPSTLPISFPDSFFAEDGVTMKSRERYTSRELLPVFLILTDPQTQQQCYSACPVTLALYIIECVLHTNATVAPNHPTPNTTTLQAILENPSVTVIGDVPNFTCHVPISILERQSKSKRRVMRSQHDSTTVAQYLPSMPILPIIIHRQLTAKLTNKKTSRGKKPKNRKSADNSFLDDNDDDDDDVNDDSRVHMVLSSRLKNIIKFNTDLSEQLRDRFARAYHKILRYKLPSIIMKQMNTQKRGDSPIVTTLYGHQFQLPPCFSSTIFNITSKYDPVIKPTHIQSFMPHNCHERYSTYSLETPFDITNQEPKHSMVDHDHDILTSSGASSVDISVDFRGEHASTLTNTPINTITTTLPHIPSFSIQQSAVLQYLELNSELLQSLIEHDVIDPSLFPTFQKNPSRKIAKKLTDYPKSETISTEVIDEFQSILPESSSSTADISNKSLTLAYDNVLQSFFVYSPNTQRYAMLLPTTSTHYTDNCSSIQQHFLYFPIHNHLTLWDNIIISLMRTTRTVLWQERSQTASQYTSELTSMTIASYLSDSQNVPNPSYGLSRCFDPPHSATISTTIPFLVYSPYHFNIMTFGQECDTMDDVTYNSQSRLLEANLSIDAAKAARQSVNRSNTLQDGSDNENDSDQDQDPIVVGQKSTSNTSDSFIDNSFLQLHDIVSHVKKNLIGKDSETKFQKLQENRESPRCFTLLCRPNSPCKCHITLQNVIIQPEIEQLTPQQSSSYVKTRRQLSKQHYNLFLSFLTSQPYLHPSTPNDVHNNDVVVFTRFQRDIISPFIPLRAHNHDGNNPEIDINSSSLRLFDQPQSPIEAQLKSWWSMFIQNIQTHQSLETLTAMATTIPPINNISIFTVRPFLIPLFFSKTLHNQSGTFPISSLVGHLNSQVDTMAVTKSQDDPKSTENILIHTQQHVMSPLFLGDAAIVHQYHQLLRYLSHAQHSIPPFLYHSLSNYNHDIETIRESHDYAEIPIDISDRPIIKIPQIINISQQLLIHNALLTVTHTLHQFSIIDRCVIEHAMLTATPIPSHDDDDKSTETALNNILLHIALLRGTSAINTLLPVETHEIIPVKHIIPLPSYDSLKLFECEQKKLLQWLLFVFENISPTQLSNVIYFIDKQSRWLKYAHKLHHQTQLLPNLLEQLPPLFSMLQPKIVFNTFPSLFPTLKQSYADNSFISRSKYNRIFADHTVSPNPIIPSIFNDTTQQFEVLLTPSTLSCSLTFFHTNLYKHIHHDIHGAYSSLPKEEKSTRDLLCLTSHIDEYPWIYHTPGEFRFYSHILHTRGMAFFMNQDVAKSLLKRTFHSQFNHTLYFSMYPRTLLELVCPRIYAFIHDISACSQISLIQLPPSLDNSVLTLLNNAFNPISINLTSASTMKSPFYNPNVKRPHINPPRQPFQPHPDGTPNNTNMTLNTATTIPNKSVPFGPIPPQELSLSFEHVLAQRQPAPNNPSYNMTDSFPRRHTTALHTPLNQIHANEVSLSIPSKQSDVPAQNSSCLPFISSVHLTNQTKNSIHSNAPTTSVVFPYTLTNYFLFSALTNHINTINHHHFVLGNIYTSQMVQLVKDKDTPHSISLFSPHYSATVVLTRTSYTDTHTLSMRTDTSPPTITPIKSYLYSPLLALRTVSPPQSQSYFVISPQNNPSKEFNPAVRVSPASQVHFAQNLGDKTSFASLKQTKHMLQLYHAFALNSSNTVGSIPDLLFSNFSERPSQQLSAATQTIPQRYGLQVLKNSQTALSPGLASFEHVTTTSNHPHITPNIPNKLSRITKSSLNQKNSLSISLNKIHDSELPIIYKNTLTTTEYHSKEGNLLNNPPPKKPTRNLQNYPEKLFISTSTLSNIQSNMLMYLFVQNIKQLSMVQIPYHTQFVLQTPFYVLFRVLSQLELLPLPPRFFTITNHQNSINDVGLDSLPVVLFFIILPISHQLHMLNFLQSKTQWVNHQNFKYLTSDDLLSIYTLLVTVSLTYHGFRDIGTNNITSPTPFTIDTMTTPPTKTTLTPTPPTTTTPTIKTSRSPATTKPLMYFDGNDLVDILPKNRITNANTRIVIPNNRVVLASQHSDFFSTSHSRQNSLLQIPQSHSLKSKSSFGHFNPQKNHFVQPPYNKMVTVPSLPPGVQFDSILQQYSSVGRDTGALLQSIEPQSNIIITNQPKWTKKQILLLFQLVSHQLARTNARFPISPGFVTKKIVFDTSTQYQFGSSQSLNTLNDFVYALYSQLHHTQQLYFDQFLKISYFNHHFNYKYHHLLQQLSNQQMNQHHHFILFNLDALRKFYTQRNAALSLQCDPSVFNYLYYNNVHLGIEEHLRTVSIPLPLSRGEQIEHNSASSQNVLQSLVLTNNLGQNQRPQRTPAGKKAVNTSFSLANPQPGTIKDINPSDALSEYSLDSVFSQLNNLPGKTITPIKEESLQLLTLNMIEDRLSDLSPLADLRTQLQKETNVSFETLLIDTPILTTYSMPGGTNLDSKRLQSPDTPVDSIQAMYNPLLQQYEPYRSHTIITHKDGIITKDDSQQNYLPSSSTSHLGSNISSQDVPWFLSPLDQLLTAANEYKGLYSPSNTSSNSTPPLKFSPIEASHDSSYMNYTHSIMSLNSDNNDLGILSSSPRCHGLPNPSIVNSSVNAKNGSSSFLNQLRFEFHGDL